MPPMPWLLPMAGVSTKHTMPRPSMMLWRESRFGWHLVLLALRVDVVHPRTHALREAIGADVHVRHARDAAGRAVGEAQELRLE